MESVSVAKLSDLVGSRSELCLSIYAPAQKSRKNAQRVCRNLIQHVSELFDRLQPNVDKREFIAPLEASLDRFVQILQEDSLAIFKSKTFEGFYRTRQENPELVSLTDHFHLKPLLEVFPSSRQFYLVRLADGVVKLYLANADQPIFLQEFRAGDVPGELELLPERESASMSLLQSTARAIENRIGDTPVPVIVAGPRSLLDQYRSVHAHTHFAAIEHEGETDNNTASARGLHAAAWSLAKKAFEVGVDKFVREYEQLASVGKASCEVARIGAAAREGKIAQLLLAREAEMWGDSDYERGMMKVHVDRGTRHPHETEILDEIAQTVLRYKGEVRLTTWSRMPGNAAAAAILRS